MMRRLSFRIAKSVLLGTLIVASLGASAKEVVLNDITLDVPSGYKVEESTRGVLVKSPDGEVDVWVEVYKDIETDKLIGEHDRYWKKNEVAMNGDGERSSREDGDIHVNRTDFKHATWKGDPTVLRYTAVGPYGSQKEWVLITYWASPEGDKEFNDDIQKMIGTLHVRYEK